MEPNPQYLADPVYRCQPPYQATTKLHEKSLHPPRALQDTWETHLHRIRNSHGFVTRIISTTAYPGAGKQSRFSGSESRPSPSTHDCPSVSRWPPCPFPFLNHFQPTNNPSSRPCADFYNSTSNQSSYRYPTSVGESTNQDRDP